MKTLLAIASIILLSYQIDRFYSNDDTAVVLNEAVPTLAAALSENSSTPDTSNNVVRGAVKIEKLNTVTVATTATVAKSEKSATEVKQVKFNLRQSKKANISSVSLHHKIKESGNFMALSSVQFNKNAYEEVSADDFSTIMTYADLLIFDSTLKVSVAGFTDNSGNEEYNAQLSLLRAVNIQRYLVELGVREEQIILSANGVSDPIADNRTLEGKSMNRRVELVLVNELL